MEPSIQERNKAIAEFMALKIENHKYTDNPLDKGVIVYLLPVRPHEWHTPDEMLYHSSWDWLLPVVFKIRETHDVNIAFEQGTCVCRIYAPDMINWEPNFERGNFDPEIMNVFLAVSDFVTHKGGK
jgi:hypothetical protein